LNGVTLKTSNLFSTDHFDEYLNFGTVHILQTLKLAELSSLFIVHNIPIFLLYPLNGFFLLGDSERAIASPEGSLHPSPSLLFRSPFFFFFAFCHKLTKRLEKFRQMAPLYAFWNI